MVGHKIYTNKKIVLLGLGSLGGGVATVKWLVKQGADVLVFDNKSKAELKTSLDQLPKSVSFTNDEASARIKISEADIVVVNPALPPNHPLFQFARKHNKQIENEGTLFFENCEKPIVAVTGTRGKTTTANWTAHFLKAKFKTSTTGNNPSNPFLKAIKKQKSTDVFVCEVPSFILEIFGSTTKPAGVAVLTNIYQDHYPWHGSKSAYEKAKANIYASQSKQNFLVVNADDKGSLRLIKEYPPKAQVFFFTRKTLKKTQSGIEVHNNIVRFKQGLKTQDVFSAKQFAKQWGEHNLSNCLSAVLVAHCLGVTPQQIKTLVKTLPQIPNRQELIFESKRIKVYNDTTATSPEGSLAAIRRFSGHSTILLAGGTDKDLDYTKWGREVLKCMGPEQIILLSGSATTKMLQSFGKVAKEIQTHETLKECLETAFQKTNKMKQAIIVFSPGAKSFEKFKNEFDRGEKFKRLVNALCQKF